LGIPDLHRKPVLNVQEGETEDATVNAYWKVLRQATSFPVVTTVIIVLCVAVFGLMAADGVSVLDPTPEQLVRWGAGFTPLTTAGQWWRLITACFIHIGIVHLLMNMWCLGSIGELTERLYGSGRFLTLYVLAGLGGSIASYFFHPNSVCAGASGAIFGVAGGMVALFIFQKDLFPTVVFKKITASFGGFIAYNLIYGMTKTSIDNSAHVGGLISGFMVGLIMASSACRDVPSIVIDSTKPRPPVPVNSTRDLKDVW
jgi:rhomboid protease GluP